MGKKMKENSKAVAARERKEEVAASAKSKKAKAADDAKWAVNDKDVLKKAAAKEDAEQKRLEAARKKAEAKALLAEEEKALAKAKSVAAHKQKTPLPKKTHAEINAAQEKARHDAAAAAEQRKTEQQKKLVNDDSAVVAENPNRAMADFVAQGGVDARTVTEAIEGLSTGEESVDRHPEKRAKAAYAAYEEAHLEAMRKDNPGMRLQQVKQQLWKQWLKAPENPRNQAAN